VVMLACLRPTAQTSLATYTGLIAKHLPKRPTAQTPLPPILSRAQTAAAETLLCATKDLTDTGALAVSALFV
jgi:hypothetical protein